MAELIKETVVTRSGDTQMASTSTKSKVSDSETTERIIYFFFGLVEVLLTFRLVLKVTGASPSSGFVSGIYALTGIFSMPFDGIFRKGSSSGMTFEPGTLIAIVVYALLAWGIVKLLQAFSGEEQSE
ncbi:MAG: hypothetical protein UW68_C0008G0015 [Candidatus Collierbacteria bacterium GW2011_GWB1_44_6]|uniref:YGGT family protein n=2 Tax=Candidatus Collieribacteriota TaxID=1752725 RepID=A0A0G1JPL0_9BACT|nr:MAG: hypothetical protein UV68_C0001G0066 [Candidatus Collierbacteria bacterium GW2011_GWC2_43_12]KKT73486.1 MAG: hypothetical protein UW68_C0008G0015 [Candidatus Collierbacteria bacterium GW2011_GWB1_44_6]KKT83866.1 MAG: hypothetical protein UW80_C0005G0014 [Microgenomates group bacterium GW2011_GWC1_44_9]